MIRLDSVSYTEHHANDETVSFHLKSGETAILMGPRGSGKSDFLKACLGFKELEDGSLKLMGKEVAVSGGDYGPPEMRDIGFVTQHQTLLGNLTIAANIGLPLSYHLGVEEAELREMVLPLMEKFEIEETADKFPYELSAVEAKVAQMARAVVLGPKLLLLDEPTGGDMDPGGFSRIILLINRFMNEGVSMLIATTSPALTCLERATLYYFVGGRVLSKEQAESTEDKEFLDYFHEIRDFIHGPKNEKMNRFGYVGRDRRVRKNERRENE